MKRFLHTIVGLSVVVILGAGLFGASASAVSCSSKSTNPLCKAQVGSNSVGGSDKSNAVSLTTRIHNIINLFIYAIGIVTVVMIVIGGSRYIMSTGDQGKMTSAKNTILYAIIGLIVAVMAYAIVGLVMSKL